MPEAARIGDPIEHSLALVGLLAGAVLGAALVVATAATGGAALALAVAGGVSMGGTVGQILGSLVPGVTSGMVSTGSGNVFTNGKMAARAGFTFVADPGAPAATSSRASSTRCHPSGSPWGATRSSSTASPQRG